MDKDYAFETLAIHAGQSPDPSTGAVMTPIFQTSTFKQDAVGVHKGFEYARTGNPTRSALEACLAAIEGGSFGLAFASGMAATDAILRLLKPGDEVLAIDDLYGGTFRILKQVFEPMGIVLRVIKSQTTGVIQQKLSEKTRIVWVESPTNPKLDLIDIAELADGLTKVKQRPLLCVDNTFATPYLQQPLKLGADLVLHSTTKYLGGHSDIVGGAIVCDDKALFDRLAFIQNAVGAIPGPMDSFLVLRGLKTLAVRMDRHASNAELIAEFLTTSPEVSDLRYPGHLTHPQYALANRQMRNGGGMLSFIHRKGETAARKFVESTQLFTLAESLGGVESLIELPAAMTHASIADTSMAIDPALIRLSVGIEAVDDLIDDLRQAFEGS
jgi:cystathionine beta-lyase/cystathionine gamma-synthase